MTHHRGTVLAPVLTPHRAHQRQAYPPGDLAIWFFIFAELTAFFALFVTYAGARAKHFPLFEAMQSQLNVTAGYLNTMVLLTGSWAVARAVAAIKQDEAKGATHWLLGGVATGIAFLAVKGWEYTEKIGQGFSLDTNLFFAFYYTLTLFHAFHVLLGLVILTFIAHKAWHRGYSALNHVGMETGAVYWHMVDLVWVVLFTLHYVVRT